MTKVINVEERCSKLKISIEWYRERARELQALGFDDEQINKVILRKYSNNSVDTLINLYPVLTNNPYNFTNAQLIKIASNNGGGKNLEVVQTNFDVLRALDFTTEQIIQMVAHNGGSKNLEAVRANIDVLRELEFNTKQITQIVAHGGGSKNLEAVTANFDALRALDFTPEQIIQMVAHAGGSKNLEAVKTNFDELRALHFTAEQIVRMVSHNGGSRNLEAVTTNSEALRERHFTAAQIVKIVSQHGGSLNLKNILDNSDDSLGPNVLEEASSRYHRRRDEIEDEGLPNAKRVRNNESSLFFQSQSSQSSIPRRETEQLDESEETTSKRARI